MTLQMDMYQSLGFAVAWLIIGRTIKAKVKFFQKYCIPAPIVGGFLFALISLVCHITGFMNFEFNTTLQTYWMVMFFTSVGYNAGFSVLKSGGKKVFIFLAVAIGLAVLQNVVALGLATVINFNPKLAIMLGSTSFTGGFGTAASFAPIVDPTGTLGALSLAVAVPTFGSLISSILGGPIGNGLIKKYNLHPDDPNAKVRLDEKGNVIRTTVVVEKVPKKRTNIFSRLFAGRQKEEQVEEVVKVEEKIIHKNSAKGGVGNSKTSSDKELTSERMLVSFMLLVLASGFGLFVTNLFNSFSPNFKFPIYIGAMLVAAIIRNIADATKVVEISMPEIDSLGNIALNMFLALALVSLRLWQLVDLAIPLLIILTGQVVVMVLYTRYVTFNAMGRNYDAAVITAGHVGFGFAATPNAIANMGSVCEKYGYSKIAFFVVPMVGSLFIDFFNIMLIGTTNGFVTQFLLP